MPITVTIQSNQGTFQGGNYQIASLSIPSTFTSLQVNSLTFGSGTFISTTGPVGAVGVIIDPPNSNLVQLTLKGITGDTGIPLTANLSAVIPFFNPAVANTIGLTSASAISGVVTLTWF